MSVAARALLCLLLPLAVACTDREAQQRAAAEQARARAEAAAAQGARQVDEVLASGKVELAYAYAMDVASRYPDTQATAALQARLPELKAQAEKLAEARRLEALWTYHEVDDAEAGGTIYTAYIQGVVEGAGGTPPQLRLVLRRHPAWGQSVYLLLDSGGDFACQKECRVPLAADAGEPKPTLVSRAEGNIPPALFIEEDVKALALIQASKTLRLELPLADGTTRAFLFEVGALDIEKLGPAPKR